MIETGSALPQILDAVRELTPQGEKVYLVGGAVRDLLLGKSCHDMDFVVEGDGRPLARRLANYLDGAFYVLDAERMTARVLVKAEEGNETVYDFAAMRAETLENDLRARDFTVNAIAIDIHSPQKLIDPLGGAKDLQSKLLRACSPDAFLDDPLRVMRGARLSLSLGYRLEQDTIRLMRAAVPSLQRISMERMRDELFRMVEGSQAVSAIRILDHLGVLSILLPEVGSLKGVSQTLPHLLDVWEHTLATLSELGKLINVLCNSYNEDASANLIHGMAVMRLGRFREHFTAHLEQRLNPNRSLRALLCFAALYHDIAKPITREAGEDGRIHFIGHELLGEGIVTRRAALLALSQVEVERLGRLVRLHLRIHHLVHEAGGPSKRSIFRFYRAAGEAGVDLVLLALADCLATEGTNLSTQSWERVLDVCRILLDAWWERREVEIKPQRLINGHDLKEKFGMPPGQRIGDLLEAVQEAQALGEITNREEALIFAKDWISRVDGDPDKGE